MLHTNTPDCVTSTSYKTNEEWDLTCCWWANVCLTNTLLIFCSIAYFLALFKASCCSDVSLGNAVINGASFLAPGPANTGPVCSAIGRGEGLRLAVCEKIQNPICIRIWISFGCVNVINEDATKCALLEYLIKTDLQIYNTQFYFLITKFLLQQIMSNI